MERVADWPPVAEPVRQKHRLSREYTPNTSPRDADAQTLRQTLRHWSSVLGTQVDLDPLHLERLEPIQVDGPSTEPLESPASVTQLATTARAPRQEIPDDAVDPEFEQARDAARQAMLVRQAKMKFLRSGATNRCGPGCVVC